MLTADNDVCRLGFLSLNHPLETNLLEVQDDVLHTFDHTGNGRELLVHAVDPDLTDGKTFQRGEQDATKRVADGLSVSGLKRPEFETAHGVRAFEHDHLVRFLKC